MKSPRGDGPPDQAAEPTSGPVSGSGVSGLTLLVEETRITRLQPGDIVVVKVSRLISDAEHDYFLDHVKPLFPDNQVLVLDGGADLAITRPEGAAGDD